jgi:hypothetical protein
MKGIRLLFKLRTDPHVRALCNSLSYQGKNTDLSVFENSGLEVIWNVTKGSRPDPIAVSWNKIMNRRI